LQPDFIVVIFKDHARTLWEGNMSKLRRFDPSNRPVFVACVTHHRHPVLIELTRPLVTALKHIRDLGVNVPAWVVLPDHLHAIIELGDISLSGTVHRFKRKLSAICYRRNHRGRIWQHRFWDHIIRDQKDFNRHLDYIHFNPVKHGLASGPKDWSCSSFHEWVDEGVYQPDWGRTEHENGREFGE